MRHLPCLIWYSYNSWIAYTYLYHQPWITEPVMRYMVQALGSKKQSNPWACLGCSWRSCYGLWGDCSLSDIFIHVSLSLDHHSTAEVYWLFLWDIFHASYDTHKNSGIVYPYMYHRPWTIKPLLRYMVQAPGSKKQPNPWACMGCSSGSCIGLWGSCSLWDVVHVSYNTYKTVG